jgi:hypothetical protein
MCISPSIDTKNTLAMPLKKKNIPSGVKKYMVKDREQTEPLSSKKNTQLKKKMV